MRRGSETFELRRYLGRRMLPVAAMLVAVVATGVPTAYLVVRVDELRRTAADTARELSRVVEREANRRPTLWRYDTLKLLRHQRAHTTRSDVAQILVLDHADIPIDMGSPASGSDREHLVWETASIEIGGERLGAVWVGVSVRATARRALVLGLGFGALGLLIAGLVTWVSRRAIHRAEKRIGALVRDLEASREELVALNSSLEAQVKERSARLQSALADLERQEEHLRAITGHTLAAQEAERRAIGRDLHDSAGQALTALRIQLQLVAQTAAGSEKPTAALLQRGIAMADEAVDEIRRAVERLSAAILDDVGLFEAVRRTCEDFGERTGVRVVTNLSGSPVVGDPAIGPEVETSCYRIVQEALTNVARHADASAVEISLLRRQNGLVLELRDDGAGFDPGSPTAGHGIAGMRERVELLGGCFELSSETARGTHLRVEIPLSL